MDSKGVSVAVCLNPSHHLLNQCGHTKLCVCPYHTGGILGAIACAWDWQSEQSNHNQSTEALDKR